MEKQRAPRNRTLTIDHNERKLLQNAVSFISKKLETEQIIDKTFNNNLFDVIDLLPEKSADLMIIDPPYNLDKDFHGYKFSKTDNASYVSYLESWFPKIIKLLKSDASLYICGDWKSSVALFQVVSKYLIVRNRIIWQREKGRGAKNNWKNCSEDIWFATVSGDYYFDADAVKIKRKVLAPYKENGKPKDWEQTDADAKGRHCRQGIQFVSEYFRMLYQSMPADDVQTLKTNPAELNIAWFSGKIKCEIQCFRRFC
ncbi:hypothetical protein CHS0354_001935 [Potamilus streckersoni]|uniref:DNA methylase N-4/N-6 domain-containing protein n=1 Tax=Potamilus streckersoni TaxID=2493646 RepID=A0AAE0T609_9BIVA|nr:hypothetical protein CHS0354_001935 [Potamilus streckersoni]